MSISNPRIVLLMNKLNIGLFGAVIALAGTLFGVFTYADFQTIDSSNGGSPIGLMLGHVTMTVRDQDGTITAYHQSDNFVMRQGEDCIAKLIFLGEANTAGSSSVCSSDIGQFNNIVLLNLTATTLEGDTALTTGGFGIVDNAGLTATACGTLTLTVATGTGGAHVDCDKTFTNLGGSNTITAAALINQTTTTDSTMLTKQDISGGVTVGTGSTLTVEWDLDIGGASAIGE